jgi:adenylate cyclase
MAHLVGSPHLGANEVATLTAIKAWHRDIIQPLMAKHSGRVVKLMGDGVLAEFASAVNAVECAVELQETMAAASEGVAEGRRITLRVGINLGDVIVEGTDLYGDGINIAARLEAIAEPGGICLSDDAHRQVRDKLDVAFEDVGEHQLKNIARPLRIFRVRSGTLPVAPLQNLTLPDKPSIVVLPFVNMSADAEQSYFVDGLTEDLITDLSKVSELFVIARNSSFAYKGRSIDVRQIARELGVKYVLEGSARRAADRVRINAQLVDALAGGHIWADRFDRDLANIFAAQDEVVGRIVEELVGKLTAAGLKERYRPANLGAYDLCLRGRAEWAHSPEAGVEAIPLFERAIALDPNYAEAYRWLAISQCEAWAYMNRPIDPLRQLSMASARKAVELDPDDSGSHGALAYVLLHERRWDESAKEYEISLRLNPNGADVWADFAALKSYEGRGAEAIACVEKAVRLNPHPPGWYFWILGFAQYAVGQYEAAVKTLENEATYRTESRRILAAALAQLGRLEEAREEAKLYLAGNPHFRINHWLETVPYRDMATRDGVAKGMRKAGLPE